MAALTLDRRSLLKLLGCGGCALSLPALSGCTIAEVFGGGAATVPFDLAEARFAGLKSVGGTATVDAAGRNLILLRTDANTVVALSRICTHTACDMAPGRFGRFDGSKLICTCHDSHFAPSGEVLKGPATRDLKSFPVQFDAAGGTGTVTIGDEPEADAAVDAGPVADGGGIPPQYADLTNPFAQDAEAVEAGRVLYQSQACAACHGPEGEGNAFPGATAFNVDQLGSSDGYLFWRIREGVPGTAMAAYPALNDDDTWRIVTYLRSLQP
jgi:cytochrome b6-f complex iron-sulfur subunit